MYDFNNYNLNHLFKNLCICVNIEWVFSTQFNDFFIFTLYKVSFSSSKEVGEKIIVKEKFGNLFPHDSSNIGILMLV